VYKQDKREGEIAKSYGIVFFWTSIAVY